MDRSPETAGHGSEVSPTRRELLAQRLITKAIGATSPAQAASLWRKCQLQQFDEGGYLVWGNLPYVDAAANNVRGLTAGAGFSFNNWRLQDGWLD